MKWKLYFWIYSALTLIGFLSILPSITSYNFGAIEGVLESIPLVLATFSYVYYKKIFPTSIWKVIFWYLILLWILQFFVVLFKIEFLYFLISNIEGTGTIMSMLFSILLSVPAMIAMNRLSRDVFLRKDVSKLEE